MRAFLAAFLSIITLTAWGQESTPQFRLGDIALGESVAQFRRHDPECFDKNIMGSPNYRLDRFSSANSVSFQFFVCSINTETSVKAYRLADLPVLSRDISISDDHVVILSYDFDNRDYSLIRSTVIDQLGEPKTIENKDGCESIDWSNATAIAHLRNCESSEHAEIFIASRDFLSKVVRETRPRTPSVSMRR